MAFCMATAKETGHHGFGFFHRMAFWMMDHGLWVTVYGVRRLRRSELRLMGYWITDTDHVFMDNGVA